MQEVVERVAFVAREDKRVDKRSGVSQRLPISVMENVISNAERRAIHNNEELVVPALAIFTLRFPPLPASSNSSMKEK